MYLGLSAAAPSLRRSLFTTTQFKRGKIVEGALFRHLVQRIEVRVTGIIPLTLTFSRQGRMDSSDTLLGELPRAQSGGGPTL